MSSIGSLYLILIFLCWRRAGSPIMQKKYACVKYVHSRVTVYYTSKIELKWRRSLHSCAVCDVAQLKKLGLPCGAIHYGICTAVSLPFPLSLVNCKKSTGTPAKKPIQRVQPKVISQVECMVYIKQTNPSLVVHQVDTNWTWVTHLLVLRLTEGVKIWCQLSWGLS